MNRQKFLSQWPGVMAALLLAGAGVAAVAAESVATVVQARTANGYKRERLPDGAFKPEFYRFASGGRIGGTGSDVTVDRVTFPEIAAVAHRVLAQQNYHYARNPGEAQQLIMLYWGSTLGYDRTNQGLGITEASFAMSALRDLGPETDANRGDPVRSAAKAVVETALIKIAMENQVRDQINLANARVLGYVEELNDADGPQRLSAGATRYDDLIDDVEESRYYIVIVAYDMAKMVNDREPRLLWVTRVSVRAPGNRFDDTFAAMLKSASIHVGQSRDRLIRGEESKGVVELGDLKFLGVAKEPEDKSGPSSAGEDRKK